MPFVGICSTPELPVYIGQVGSVATWLEVSSCLIQYYQLRVIQLVLHQRKYELFQGNVSNNKLVSSQVRVSPGL